MVNIMRKFNVTVNGTVYEVEVEEVEAGAVSSAPAAAAAPKAAAKPAAAAPKAAPAGKTQISAPMAGTIVKINVSAGQSVKKGDVVAILEAMKMENEIFAPADGTVASVSVSKGASVAAGDVIISIN